MAWRPEDLIPSGQQYDYDTQIFGSNPNGIQLVSKSLLQ
jgi:hypothetical protein